MVFKSGHLHDGSLRVTTRASQERTSSNRSFQEQFRAGLGTGVSLANNAVRQVMGPVPGSAALSSSLSNVAAGLNGPSSLGGLGGFSNAGSSMGGNVATSDMGSLQEEMVKSNNELLQTQAEVAQITNVYQARSNLMKVLFETMKHIGSNIR